MDRGEHAKAAAQLLDAAARRRPIAPIVESYPGATVDDGYAIQQGLVHAWTAAGDVVRGHKVGLASRAMQRQMGVDQPDYGHLTRRMFHLERQPIPADTFIQPRIEPEIAFVLGADLAGPGVTVADAMRAVDAVLPSLEIVDSRIRDWRISIVDTIADNASSGGVVLGTTALSLRDLDVRLLGCNLSSNGRVVATGAGGAVLGSPINVLAWLANTIGPLGVTLRAGDVILPGSLTRAIPMNPGDTVTATFAHLGSVTAVLACRVESVDG